MIVINVVICFLALFLDAPGRLIDAADVVNNRGQVLRRRTGFFGKKDDRPVNNETGAVVDTETEPPKLEQQKPSRFISFDLRKRTKSNEKRERAPSVTFASAFSNFFSSAVAGFNKLTPDIDKLEVEYYKQQQLQLQQVDEADQHEVIDMSRSQISRVRDEVATKLISGDYPDFEDPDTDDESEIGSSSIILGKERKSPSDMKLSVILGGDSAELENDRKKTGDAFDRNEKVIVEKSQFETVENVIESPTLTQNQYQVELSASNAFGPRIDSSASIESQEYFFSDPNEIIDYEQGIVIDSSGAVESQEQVIDNEQQDVTITELPTTTISPASSQISSESDLVPLTDEDFDSWEKVERNILENVEVLVKKPVTLKLLRKFVHDKQTIVQFLAAVFIKLARRIFFDPMRKSMSKSSSVDEFVIDFPTQEEVDASEQAKQHQFLDFETAHRVLFYDDAQSEHQDWCLILPEAEDFFAALDFLNESTSNVLKVIDFDIDRLPPKYYDFYAEKLARAKKEGDRKELQEKLKLLLAFILAFESKESSSLSPESVTSSPTSTTPRSNDKQITYAQGFEQILAYFAINFDLDLAGPIAYRFFQLYMAELINPQSKSLKEIFGAIDSRAVKMVRAYLSDQFESTVLDFEPILGVLELFPFSDCSASILYFSSTTTWTDLDRLIQFLLLKVPQDHAYKSISLLAASNMLSLLLVLDRLFVKELGSQEWSQLKESINNSEGEERFKILDSLMFKFFEKIFVISRAKIVHVGEGFNEFMRIAESLVEYLPKVN